MKRNQSKELTKEVQQQSWERYVSILEHDIHDRQTTITSKVLKHLNVHEYHTVI